MFGNGLVVAKGCLFVLFGVWLSLGHGFLALASGLVVAKGGLVVGCWCLVVAG